jgi:hypothetical protein
MFWEGSYAAQTPGMQGTVLCFDCCHSVWTKCECAALEDFSSGSPSILGSIEGRVRLGRDNSQE